MAPARARKQDTSIPSADGIPSFPAPPTAPPQAPTRTPERSPTKRMAGITQVQKQALIDNLQLEITERARKLRWQYTQQAQALRTRLEMRVNRIPSALRKRTIQELIDEHAANAKPAAPPPMAAVKAQVTSTKTTKRKSDEISADDKENNLPSDNAHDLANPKKRAKTAVANSKATRTTSRKAEPTGVLSPKSHNSRTLPQSPLKPSPEKAQPARPMLSTKSRAARPTVRAPSRVAKRGGLPSEGRTSEGSNTSAGTTIVTKPGARKAPLPKQTAPAPKAKKTVAAKPEAATPGVGRILRKRN